MNRTVSVSFTIVVLSLFFFAVNAFFPVPSEPKVLSSSIRSVGTATTVSLSIGEYRFTLYGYTSPQALVTIEGMGIFDQTYANDKGYFEFANKFSPYSPREACLTAQDQLGRLSPPVCLAPFPTKYDITIGPIIMPPTLSLDKSDYFVGDEVKLTGQTVPNTRVDLSVFTKNKDSRGLKADFHEFFIKPAYAASLPQLDVRSDDEGNFAVALPSSEATSFRLFAKTNYQKEESPQSLLLSLKVLPVWMIIVKLFLLLFSIIKSRLLEVFILAQLGALIFYLFRCYLHPHAIARNRSIVLRDKYAIERFIPSFCAVLL